MITKGEWKVAGEHKNKGYEFVVEGRGHTIAMLPNKRLGILIYDNKETLPNARLIAAAPDMYEALKELQHYYRAHGGELSQKTSKALAKAEGK